MSEPTRSKRRRRRRRRAQVPAPSPVAAASAPSGLSYVGSRFLRVPPRQVYGMVARLDRLPRWSSLWMRAEVMERKPATLTVRLWGYIAGLPVESVVRATLQPSTRVTWQQAYGTLVGYSAAVDVQPSEEGTLITYRVELTPGVRFLSEEAIRQVLVQEVEQTLSRLKWSAERDILSEEIRRMRARTAQGEGTGRAHQDPP